MLTGATTSSRIETVTPPPTPVSIPWGSPLYSHCKLNYTLEDLRERKKQGRLPHFRCQYLYLCHISGVCIFTRVPLKGTQVTCFTRTKVQILTPTELPHVRTGGLGKNMQPYSFEVWVCVDQHNCGYVNPEISGMY
jgi:hypothetical protein